MREFDRGATAGICSFLIAALLAVCATAGAATLVLNDGSVIHGDVKALQGDVYTVETDSLGTVRVRKEDLRTIDLSGESTLRSPARSSTEELQPGQTDLRAVQSRMMQNPDLFSMVRALQDDPQVQAVLSDPEIMRAIASGDIATLMNNPRIIGLTSNPKIREIIDEAR